MAPRTMTRLLFFGSLVWALLVVFAVHFIDFPGSVPNFENASGGGTLLDVRPAFSEKATRERLEAYGEQGRENYAFRNITVDILLPLSVLPFLFLLMRRAAGQVRIRRWVRLLLLSLPFIYVIFDFAENIAVITMLARYPSPLGLVSSALPSLTVVKRAASMLSLAIPLLILAVVRLRGGPRTLPGG